jgi:hypothetical protein
MTELVEYLGVEQTRAEIWNIINVCRGHFYGYHQAHLRQLVLTPDA